MILFSVCVSQHKFNVSDMAARVGEKFYPELGAYRVRHGTKKKTDSVKDKK